jgi:NTP pyrophosphatase (non-canonical NTP hydrolase)
VIDLNDVDFDVIAERVLEREDDDHNAAAAWQLVCVGEEAGEVQKEGRAHHGHSRHSVDNRDKYAEEMADVVIATAVLAALEGIDLNEAVNVKLAKIQNRGGL